MTSVDKGMGVKLRDDEELSAMLLRAKARVAAMTPEERLAMIEAQRQSFVRAMAPCEHGIADWEDCSDCRRQALSEALDAAQ